MYRGRKAFLSWTMTSCLTIASALGVVIVSHTLQTPQAAIASAAPTTSTVASTSSTVAPTTYTITYHGDDGAASRSGFDN